MITKNDCLILLADLQNKGIDTSTYTQDLIENRSPLISIIKFINTSRQLDLAAFYEQLRKNYNHKKSKLYRNIVKEIDDPNDVLSTLSAMLTQILLFAKKADDRQMFLRHARSAEITAVLNNYFKTYDLTSCLKLLRLIKIDLKALEQIKE